MTKGLFVTGTDTDVGKTIASAILAEAFSSKTKTGYFKPVQAGSLENSDTDRVRKLTSNNVECVNPVYALKLAASPNRAARAEDTQIELKHIAEKFIGLPDRFYIVEGAGGCMVPLNSRDLVVDLMGDLNLPAVVVASTRLGTINHTVLTCQSLALRGIKVKALILMGDEDPGLKEVLLEQLDLPAIIEIPLLPELTPQTLQTVISTNNELQNFVDDCLRDGDVSSRVESLDRKFIWHPFTQHKHMPDMPEVVQGRGAYLKLANGETLFDGISSWWVNTLGHCQKDIAQAISTQAHQLEHAIFAGFTHEPAVALVQRLVDTLGQKGCNLQRGFFSDNGSTSVEVALKMAFQFHFNKGHSRRLKFLALKGSYHGDTLGAMSLGASSGFFKAFEPLLFEVDYISPDTNELRKAIERNGEHYAAVIVEPMVQGAGGMNMYPAAFLDQLGELCKAKGILTIADEVFTGFGRTGKLFAFEHSSWRPDLLCLSKGLTGGFLPLSLTMATEEIFMAFQDDKVANAFLHGHSYTANPIGCRAALTAVNLVTQPRWQEAIAELSRITEEQIGKLSQFSWCLNPRSLGVIGAFEFTHEKDYFNRDFAVKFTEAMRKESILLRPLGNTVYVCPPYCTTTEELINVYDKIKKILISWEKS